ncbi:GNAT family N-acetyltransferase [Paenibacillus brevis]|uniref:GNAT family N-acetyltransferase n=1 Tax=Paenibacillus brevis TaxID=2841508 RepID=A0ABS6FLU1_9BACL|nr:GNAT family N-acetyltransferase [Paenibacillus brevis]MBU5670408.1 GNAT family N-acetyltransferase [Paenibacillus brevis]
MIELKIEDYSLATAILEQVPFNTWFAQAVLRGLSSGRVFVDRLEHAEACYIQSAYGMSLLCGESHTAEFLEALTGYLRNEHKHRVQREWLQVYPDSWNVLLRHLAEDGPIEENTRINFTFNRAFFQRLVDHISSSEQCEVVAIDKKLFYEFDGAVVPRRFWKNADQFVAAGAGFCVLQQGRPVSVAFSAYRVENYLEIGIETVEEARGNGFAIQASIALIRYCLEHHLEPVWACRRENEGSYQLAQKLGFVPSLRIPYYLLKA